MTKPRVSVSIVNWNGARYIDQCLSAVRSQVYDGRIEITIVDNDSKDGSLSIVEERHPEVTIIRNSENLGFCAAQNQAIRSTTGDYVLALNFDVILEKDFIGKIIASMQKDVSLGMVSGKLYLKGNGGNGNILDSTGITMPQYFSHPRGASEEDHSQYDGELYRNIFAPCGAAAFYRRKMLEDIKYNNEYFDEDFVNYVEDVDLGWRGLLKGWKARFVPSAVAYHVRGVTREKNKAEQYNYFLKGYRNRYLAMYKNMTAKEMKEYGGKIFVRELVFILSRKDGAVTPFTKIKALKDAMALRPKIRAKRKKIQQDIAIDIDTILPFFGYREYSTFKLIMKKIWSKLAIIYHFFKWILMVVKFVFVKTFKLLTGKDKKDK